MNKENHQEIKVKVQETFLLSKTFSVLFLELTNLKLNSHGLRPFSIYGNLLSARNSNFVQ